MWTAAAMSREANCSYNQCFAFTFEGPLRVESLRAALDQVVARHDALRAVIAPDGAGQTLRPPFSVDVPLVDLSTLDPETRRRDFERLLERECETPFDLAEGPLLRAFVVRESAGATVFVLTAHHIVCDGWSSSVLFSELGLLYSGRLRRHPGAARSRGVVPGLRRRASRATTTSPRLLADEEYWAAQYPTGAPVLDLPLAGARPAAKTYASAREHLLSTRSCTLRSSRPGRNPVPRCSRPCVAAFEALVYRLSGQSDFVVGIPFAEQPLLENSDARRPLRQYRAVASPSRPGGPVRRAPPHRS